MIRPQDVADLWPHVRRDTFSDPEIPASMGIPMVCSTQEAFFMMRFLAAGLSSRYSTHPLPFSFARPALYPRQCSFLFICVLK